MGFTTGLLGGVALTTSVLYLTTQAHTQNRLRQAALLRRERLHIESIREPFATLDPSADPYKTLYPPPDTEDLATRREVQVGALDAIKEGWNSQITSLVKRAQTTDWGRVSEDLEGTVERLWSRVRARTEEVTKDVTK